MKIISFQSTSAPSSQKPGINWKYQFQQYGFAFLVATFLFVVLSIYLFYRRGYYDLYIANKVFAGVSAVLLGIVLLIGPGSRLFSFPDRYVQYRKELGTVAFFLALIHGIVSFFSLPSKFPMSEFLGTLNWPFIFGLLATLTLIGIFFITNDWAMNTLGREKWYQVGGGKEFVHPEWPGAGLLVGWFMAFVIFIRLAEFISPKLGKAVWYISIIALPLIYIVTFWWGVHFVK